jgi:hypothetical protein
MRMWTSIGVLHGSVKHAALDLDLVRDNPVPGQDRARG